MNMIHSASFRIPRSTSLNMFDEDLDTFLVNLEAVVAAPKVSLETACRGNIILDGPPYMKASFL